MESPEGTPGGSFIQVLIAFARIICRINIGNALRPHPMQLDDGVLSEPRIMLHIFRRASKPSGLESISLFLIELVAHADVKCPRDDGDMFIIRMNMRRNFVSGRHLQANDIESFL